MDRILLFFGVVGCVVYGSITPGQFLILGSVVQDFIDFTVDMKHNKTSSIDIEDKMTDIALWYIGLAVANMFFSWLGMGLFALSAERQVHKMRLALFRSAIYQDIGWFDVYTAGELNTRLTEYVIY